MSDTPRCDEHVLNWRNLAPGEVSTMGFARQLERELNAAKAENAAMREAIKESHDALSWCYDVVEWPADGLSKQDRAITKLKPYLK